MKIATFDETTSGVRAEGPMLDFAGPKITVDTLIETRIRTEIDAKNDNRKAMRTLVSPNNPQSPLKVDFKKQLQIARDAFKRGQLLVLLPNGQAESLDETLTLDDGDEVTFLRLVPLIGG